MKHGFTLVEVLITLAIVVMITVASIPLLNRLSTAQLLDQQTSQVVDAFRHAQTQSVSGIHTSAISTNRDWWGIEIPCSASDKKTYRTGYVITTASALPAVGATFFTDRTWRLADTISFSSVGTFVCNGTTRRFLFEPFSGLLYTESGVQKDYLDVGLVDTRGETKQLYVSSAGKIERKEP